MKNLITLALLFTLFSCEKEDSTGTKNWFPYEIDTIYYHSYPDPYPDSTDSKIVFKNSNPLPLNQFPTDFSDIEITISMSPTALTAINLGDRPVEGFELFPSDFSPEIFTFEEGTFLGIRVDGGDSTKILYP